MELCGQNLHDYVYKNPFNFQKSFSYSKQLASGLAYLHANNVVHRDLKPGNVLISLDEKTIKLSDFGLSREIPAYQSAATVTAISAGTEGYKSPETYQEDTHVFCSLDIFPYGLVIHFIFSSGKHPFGSNPNEWSYRIMKNKKRDFSNVPQFNEPNSHKKAQLLDLLTLTLMQNPRDRPTAEDIKKHVFFAGKSSVSLQDRSRLK